MSNCLKKGIPLQAWTGRPLGFQVFEARRISRLSLCEDGKVVSRMHRPPFTPRVICLVLISVRNCTDPKAVVRLAGLVNEKTSMAPSGTEPATLRLVAQCLNQLRHLVPPNQNYDYIYKFVSYLTENAVIKGHRYELCLQPGCGLGKIHKSLTTGCHREKSRHILWESNFGHPIPIVVMEQGTYSVKDSRFISLRAHNAEFGKGGLVTSKETNSFSQNYGWRA